MTKQCIVLVFVTMTLGFGDFAVDRQFATAPLDRPRGLAWAGNNLLWAVANEPDSGPMFACFDTAGNPVQSFSTPNHLFLGLAYDGTYLWVGSGEVARRIYRVNVATGALVDSFRTPRASNSNANTSPHGLEFSDDSLWVMSAESIYRISTVTRNWRTVGPAPGPGTMAEELAYGQGYLWASWYVNASTRYIYRLSPANGAIIETHRLPVTIPSGLAYDGSSLWTCKVTADTIYRLSAEVSEEESAPDPKRSSPTLECCPSPFASRTRIRVQLGSQIHRDRGTRYDLDIRDAAGRIVRQLRHNAGSAFRETEIVWDGTDESGNRLPAGAYFVLARTADHYASFAPVVFLR